MDFIYVDYTVAILYLKCMRYGYFFFSIQVYAIELDTQLALADRYGP